MTAEVPSSVRDEDPEDLQSLLASLRCTLSSWFVEVSSELVALKSPKAGELFEKSVDVLQILSQAEVAASGVSEPSSRRLGGRIQDFILRSSPLNLSKAASYLPSSFTRSRDKTPRNEASCTPPSKSRTVATIEEEGEAERPRVLITSKSDPLTVAAQESLLLQESNERLQWWDTMKEGSCFWRVTVRYKSLGRALKYIQVSQVFLSLSCDFRQVLVEVCSNSSHSGEAALRSGQKPKKKKKTTYTLIALDKVDGFDHGKNSECYKLLEDKSFPDYLCFTLKTPKGSVNLVAHEEKHLEHWVMGLNSLIPFFPGRQILTTTEFNEMVYLSRREYLRKMNFRALYDLTMEQEAGGTMASNLNEEESNDEANENEEDLSISRKP